MAEKLSLRIDNGVRIIEVNDDGDTINLNLGDSEFQKKGMEIYNALTEKIKIMEAITEETDENLQKIEDIRKSMVKSIDDWIGKDTCKKVFGNISPSLDLITIFISEIIPFIEEYNDNREKRTQKVMNKYNPNRKGR